MSGHTAGPWRVGGKGWVVADHPVPEVNGSDALEYYGGHLICESVAEKNTALIAASPNLLAACEQALNRFDAYQIYGPERKAIEEAIKEAKGEA